MKLLRKERKKNDFDPERRKFLELIGKGALAVGIAALIGEVMYTHYISREIVQLTDIKKFVKPELPFVVVIVKPSGAIVRDEKMNKIFESTDHADAIQRAINYVVEQGGGAVFLGPGEFIFKKSVVVDDFHGGLLIQGAGQRVTRIRIAADVRPFLFRNCSMIQIRDLEFTDPNGQQGTAKFCIHMSSVFRPVVENVTFYNVWGCIKLASYANPSNSTREGVFVNIYGHSIRGRGIEIAKGVHDNIFANIFLGANSGGADNGLTFDVTLDWDTSPDIEGGNYLSNITVLGPWFHCIHILGWSELFADQLILDSANYGIEFQVQGKDSERIWFDNVWISVMSSDGIKMWSPEGRAVRNVYIHCRTVRYCSAKGVNLEPSAIYEDIDIQVDFMEGNGTDWVLPDNAKLRSRSGKVTITGDGTTTEFVVLDDLDNKLVLTDKYDVKLTATKYGCVPIITDFDGDGKKELVAKFLSAPADFETVDVYYYIRALT